MVVIFCIFCSWRILYWLSWTSGSYTPLQKLKKKSGFHRCGLPYVNGVFLVVVVIFCFCFFAYREYVLIHILMELMILKEIRREHFRQENT